AYEFFEAVICSRNKLSYQSVYDLLTPTPEAEQTEIPTEAQSMLHELHRFALARIRYRAEHAWVMDQRADYLYFLNQRKTLMRGKERTQHRPSRCRRSHAGDKYLRG